MAVDRVSEEEADQRKNGGGRTPISGADDDTIKGTS